MNAFELQVKTFDAARPVFMEYNFSDLHQRMLKDPSLWIENCPIPTSGQLIYVALHLIASLAESPKLNTKIRRSGFTVSRTVVNEEVTVTLEYKGE